MAYAPMGALLDAVTAEMANALALLDRESFSRLLLARRASGLAGTDPVRNIDGRTVALVATQLSMAEHVADALLELSQREMTVLRVLWRSGPAVRLATIVPAFARLLDERSLDRCLERLQDLALLLPIDKERSALFVPACVRAVLLKRSGPARPAATIFGALRTEDLQRICAAMGVDPKVTRKADRLDAIVEELAQPDRVRLRLDSLPDLARRVFDAVVREGGSAEPYSLVQKIPELSKDSKQFGYGYYLHDLYNRRPAKDGLPLLENQGLLVRFPPDWASKLVVCDEVLTALLPPLQITAADFNEPAFEAPHTEARPAGGHASPVLDVVECLQFVDEQRPSLTQKGLFAKPDAKRLARWLSVNEGAYADFVFSLTMQAGLLRREGQQLSVKKKSEQWLKASELEQRSALFEAWKELTDWRDDRDEGYARGGWFGTVIPYRDATLRLLVDLPEAGAATASAVRKLQFRIPNLFPPPSPGGAAANGSPTPERWLLGALRSLAWLGLAEPLIAPGSTAPAGLRLTATGRALLNADTTVAADEVPRVDGLIVQPTLDVLAPPNIEPVVYRALRAFTDPVSAAGMRTVTLTMNALRRTVDAGQQPAAVRTFLEQHTSGPLPSTVDRLLADIGAKYGRIHAGQASYYLTVDDPHLLAELGADKRLSGMIERVIAPTVALVRTEGMPALLERLRAAGHMPVQDRREATAARTTPESSPSGPIRFPAAAKRTPAMWTSTRGFVPAVWESDADGEDGLGDERIVPFVPPGAVPVATADDEADGVIDMSLVAYDPAEIAEIIQDAVGTDLKVQIEYRGKIHGRDQRTIRIIEPYRFDGSSITAYCQLRQGEREFKLNRIIWARLMDY